MQCSKALSQLICSRQSLLQSEYPTYGSSHLLTRFGKQLKLNLFQSTHTFWCLSFKLLPLNIFIYILKALLKLNMKDVVKFLSALNFVQSHLQQRHFLRGFREFQIQGNLIRTFFTLLYIRLVKLYKLHK